MNVTIRKATHQGVAPLIIEQCDALLLGSMLSPKSAEARFYYAHPQNRFWPVLAAVFGERQPTTSDERAAFALEHKIALWDVLSECDIVGAADSTIKNAKFNDIDGLLKAYPNITRVFTTGGKAHELLLKYNKTVDNPIIKNAVRLPSTSSLNCAASLEQLIAAYDIIKQK